MGENYESSSSVEISSEISSEFEMGEVSENIEIGNEISESEESYDDYSDCVEESTEDEGDSEVPEPAEAYDDYSDCVEEAEETGADVKAEASEENLDAKLDYVEYSQGNNERGYLGTCGPTSVANSMNRVVGEKRYTENQVLEEAIENDLCQVSEDPYEAGGTNTEQVVQLVDEMKENESDIHTEVYEYDNALSVEALAEKLEEKETVAIVGVDSATLWDEQGDVTNSGLFQEEEYSDHWITVDSPTYDEKGKLSGFRIVDSGGGVSYVDKEKFVSMYLGNETVVIKDPTAIIISGKKREKLE